MPTRANMYGQEQDNSRTALVERQKSGDEKTAVNPIMARCWREVERYERAVTDWYQEGEEIVDVYLDNGRPSSSSSRRYSLLWANTETLKPAVYPRMPAAVCSRRYKDRDPIGRIAAELMERATNTSFELYGADETFRMVRDDRLLPGRGQCWVRYEAQLQITEEEITAIDNETGVEETTVQSFEKLVGEKVCVDYVHWKDFGHNIGRTWKDVWLVWRIVYKTQEEVAERFGGDKAAKLNYNAKSPSFGSGKGTDDPDDRCKIYEVWDKSRGMVYWMVQGHPEFLEQSEPPIAFRDFFPCPEPCYATKTGKELIPVPDYRYYRDQAKEINDLTDKIHRLTEWLIVKGFIPGAPSTSADPIEEVLRDKGNKELFVQVESWTEFTEKGGAAKLIDWLPLEAVIKTIQAAVNSRNQLIQDVFQLTGISDILRGQSDPNETLGAQELKAQTGSRRLKNTKEEVDRICRDTARLVAEVVAEQFQPQSIAAITGYKYVPTQRQPIALLAAPGTGMGATQPMPGMGMPQQMPVPMGHNGGPGIDDGMGEMGGDLPELTFDDRVMALLRDDKMRSFRIDVETDQTGAADENMEKQRRMELLTTFAPYMEKVALVVAQAPEMGDAMKEMLLFGVKAFRTGRALEETLDRGFSAAVKRSKAQQQAAQQQGNPEAEKAKAELALKAEVAKAEVGLESQKQQTDAMLEVRKQNIDAGLKDRQQRNAAAAQAQDRIVKAMTARPPSTTRQ